MPDRTDKVSTGVSMLQEQGHKVVPYNFDGKRWWAIDDGMLATPEEIEHIADGVYSFAEFEGPFHPTKKGETGRAIGVFLRPLGHRSRPDFAGHLARHTREAIFTPASPLFAASCKGLSFTLKTAAVAKAHPRKD